MKIKTKHIITCIKCIFLGLVMAMPFFAVLPTALYYSFNEHAIASDNYKYEYETNDINSVYDIVEGNVYHLNYDEIEYTKFVECVKDTYWNFEVPYISIEANYNSIQWSIDAIENLSDKQPTISFTDIIYLQTKIKDALTEWGYITTTYALSTNYDRIIKVNIVATEEFIHWLTSTIDTNLLEEVIQDKSISKASYLGELVKTENITNQNALEIAFNELFEKPTFSWVKNSIIATPIYAFVGAFGLTQDLFISNLIVYWTNILLIYAILNIVLVLFTKLTQLGQKKDKD